MSIGYELNGFRELLRAEKKNCTYSDLEQLYGVNKYYLWHIINDDGYSPPLKVAATLGVILMRPAPACLRCGKVPLAKHHRCNGKPHRPRHPRLAIRLDDPHSAARSILKHMPPAQLNKLVELLK